MPWYQSMLAERSTTLSPFRADIGMKVRSATSSLLANWVNSAGPLRTAPRVVDEVHLVHGQHQVGDPQERRDERVAPRLFEDSLAGVDEDDGQVSGRGPGDHVPRVLGVPGVSAMMNLRRGVAK